MSPTGPAAPAEPAVAARASAGDPFSPRLDLYRAVHKGLRRLMSAVVDGLGRADPADPAAVAAALDRLDTLVGLCRSHAHTETTHIHAVLEARRPGFLAGFDGDHADQEQTLDTLAAMAAAVRGTDGPAVRDAALHALYLAVARFVGENFEHMTREEIEIMAALRDCASEAEIAGIHHAIVSTMDAAKLTAFLVEIIPALHAGEREGMLAGMRAGMPAEAFAGLAGALLGPIAARA